MSTIKGNFVPHAIIEQASVDSMLFVACPACRRAVHSRNESNQFVCHACNLPVNSENASFSFKLVMRCSIELSFLTVILFNEVVERFLGCSPTIYYELTQKWTSFPARVAALLEGMHVSMTLRTPPAASTDSFYKKDPKVVAIYAIFRPPGSGPLVNDAIESAAPSPMAT